MTDEQNSVTPEQLHEIANLVEALIERSYAVDIRKAAEALREAQDTSQTEQIKRLQQRMNELGICATCGEIMDMNEEGPFSHCQCGTAEDYAKRPIQALQVRAMRAEAERDRLAEENRRLHDKINHHYHRGIRKDRDHRCPWRQGLEAVRDSALSTKPEEN